MREIKASITNDLKINRTNINFNKKDINSIVIKNKKFQNKSQRDKVENFTL